MIYDNRELSLPRREQAKEVVEKSETGKTERATVTFAPLPVNSKGETLITLINISQEVWRF